MGLIGWFGIVVLFAPVAAFSAYKRAAPSSLARTRAKAFLVAFGTRDGLYAAFILVVFSSVLLGLPRVGTWIQWLPSLGTLLFVLLLAYGILSTQLLGIDLKVKWGIRRGALAAVFVGAFFLVNEGAEAVVQAQYGWLPGLFAAGALAFAFRPLERLADRFADRAMPGVRDSPEYRRDRKLQIYRAALDDAAMDQEFTPRERAMLARLRAELGVSPEDAAALEAAARSARVPGGEVVES